MFGSVMCSVYLHKAYICVYVAFYRLGSVLPNYFRGNKTVNKTGRTINTNSGRDMFTYEYRISCTRARVILSNITLHYIINFAIVDKSRTKSA